MQQILQMELKACKVKVLMNFKETILINSTTQNYLYMHICMYVYIHKYVRLCVYKGTCTVCK